MPWDLSKLRHHLITSRLLPALATAAAAAAIAVVARLLRLLPGGPIASGRSIQASAAAAHFAAATVIAPAISSALAPWQIHPEMGSVSIAIAASLKPST